MARTTLPPLVGTKKVSSPGHAHSSMAQTPLAVHPPAPVTRRAALLNPGPAQQAEREHEATSDAPWGT